MFLQLFEFLAVIFVRGAFFDSFLMILKTEAKDASDYNNDASEQEINVVNADAFFNCNCTDRAHRNAECCDRGQPTLEDAQALRLDVVNYVGAHRSWQNANTGKDAQEVEPYKCG